MKITVRIAVLAIAALLAHEAYAQFGGGGFPGGGGMRGGSMRGGTRGDSGRGQRPDLPQRPANPEAIDDQLGLIEEALNLTQAQWPAWQRYADRVRALAGDVDRERNRSELAEKQNAAQQLDHAADTLRNRLTALEDIAAAARTLYGMLAPDQQGIADARLAGMVLRLTGVPQPGVGNRSRD